MRRTLRPLLRWLALALVLGVSVTPAFADGRSEARTHYQAGVKFYNANDYRSAIREFSAAQQLMPADLNNYNLALCYDKLGDADPAIQYYKAFLAKQSNSDKRAEIDASVARLEAASKSVAAKKADEAKRTEEARKADEARTLAEEARKADEARKIEEARKAAEASKRPVEDAPPIVEPLDRPPVVGSAGAPSTGEPAPTGNAQLDRVQRIDINAIRNERLNSGGSTRPANGREPNAQNGSLDANGTADPRVAQANMPPQNGQQPLPRQDQPATQSDPVYKKWWFWVIVGVGAYVAYEIATEDSSDNVSRLMPIGGKAPQASSSGMTMFSW